MTRDVVIGLEIHIQLLTKSKMFCGCAVTAVYHNKKERMEEPNTRVCPICMGFPGVLPVPNRKAIEFALKAGIALGCQVNVVSKFDRKNYYYPDLPKNYQISQYDVPFSQNGFVEIEMGGKPKRIRIKRAHLEEDAGKLIHSKYGDYSLVDFNRAGTPLLEVVTEPDITTPQEAKKFLVELQSISRYIGVSSANMEEGQMRCDANISLKKKGAKELGPKVEIKNLNSFKMVERALEHEISRQSELLEVGKKITSETRGWNDAKGVTVSQRSKEEIADYKYFPEPDIPPFDFSKTKEINPSEIRKSLPQLPAEKRERFGTQYGLSSQDVDVLTRDQALSNYFEEAVSEAERWARDKKSKNNKKELYKKVANWILTEFLALLAKDNISISECKVTPENLAELIVMIEVGTVSGKAAKEIFSQMYKTGEDPSVVLEKSGLHLVTDMEVLEKIVDEVVRNNQKAVSDYNGGKTESLKFLVGQVMAKTKGAADPKVAEEILRKHLTTDN